MAIVLWCVLHCISPVISKLILSYFDDNVPYDRLLQIHVSRLPARYIPGGIWHTVGRVSDLHFYGLKKKQLSFLVIAESIFPCLMTFLMGGGYLWCTFKQGYIHIIAGISAFVSIILLVALPIFLQNKTYQSGKVFKLITYFQVICVTAIFWIIASGSFLLYVMSFSIITVDTSYLQIAAIYIFSWGIGYLAIFAPQGIGVFEVVAGKALTLPLNLGGAVAFIAGFRIVVFLADITVWILLILSSMVKRKYFQPPRT
ncbi:hypothetical protein ACFL2E_12220 [Thermodesulfobacteriota bacterium]